MRRRLPVPSARLHRPHPVPSPQDSVLPERTVARRGRVDGTAGCNRRARHRGPHAPTPSSNCRVRMASGSERELYRRWNRRGSWNVRRCFDFTRANVSTSRIPCAWRGWMHPSTAQASRSSSQCDPDPWISFAVSSMATMAASISSVHGNHRPPCWPVCWLPPKTEPLGPEINGIQHPEIGVQRHRGLLNQKAFNASLVARITSRYTSRSGMILKWRT